MKKTKKIPYTPKYKFGGFEKTIFTPDADDKKKMKKFGKQAGTAAYGVGEGVLDTVTMGATDQLTDKGYTALQKAGNSTEDEMREQNSIRGFGNAAGAVGGAFINPGATAAAIGQVGKGLGAGVSEGNKSKDWAQGAGMALNTAGKVGSMAYGMSGSPMTPGMEAQAGNFNSSSFGQGLGKYNEFMGQGNMKGLMGMMGGMEGAEGASGIMGMLGGMGAGAEMPINKYGGYMKYEMGGEEPIHEYATKDGNNINYYKKVNTPSGPRFYTSSSPDMSTAQKITNFKINKNSADSIPMKDLPLNVKSKFINFAMSGMQYANGGTGEISGEVEGAGFDENGNPKNGENAVGPNGEFTQFKGATHAQGGIKTDMAPGTRVFSDKLKAPGTNKTFAKLNAGNNTNREDKLDTKEYLDPKSKMSIDLTRMAKMKNSDMLFAMQEQLKKNKVAAYAKRMGVELPSMDNEQMEPQGMPEQAEGEMAMARYGGMMNKMAMGGVQLPYYNTNNDGTPKYGMGGIEENINIGSNNTTSANKKMSPEEWAKYNTSLGYQQDKGSAIGKYPAFYNPKEYAINDSGAYIKIGDVGKNVDYNNDPTYKPLNQYSYKPPVAKQVISTKKAIPERDPNRPTWNFNSGDNPSFGGVSYTNAAGTGKVIPPTTLKYGGRMPKFYRGGPYDPNDEYIDPSETAMIEARDSGQYYEDSAKQAAEQNAYRIGMNNAINDPYRRNSLMTPADPYGDPNATARRDDRLAREAAEIAGTGSEGTSTTGTGGGNKYNNRDMALQGLGMVAGLSPKLAYLKNQGKKYDTQEFYGYDPSLMDPTQARKDEQYAGRQNQENIRIGSMGSGATLLANAAAQRNKTSANLGRINKEYDNANVAITNRGKEYNIGNRYAVDDINARNKGAALSNYYKTLDSTGAEVKQGTKDIRAGNQDNQMMAMIPKMINDPRFKKFFEEYQKGSSETTYNT